MVSKKVIAGILATLLVSLGVYAVGGFNKVGEALNEQLQFVSGTEYAQGEAGSTIVRVTDAFGRGVTSNWCNATIYYPDKSVWINNVGMTSGGATGSWYSDFVTPYVSGVYEQWVQCGVPLGAGERLIENSKSFHVSEPLTMLNETGSAQVVIIS